MSFSFRYSLTYTPNPHSILTLNLLNSRPRWGILAYDNRSAGETSVTDTPDV